MMKTMLGKRGRRDGIAGGGTAAFGMAAWAAVVLALGVPDSGAEMRTFTGASGGELTAEMVSMVDAERIKVRRHDGREMVTAIAAYSAEDQEYIRDWIKKNPDAMSYDLDVEIVPKKTSDTVSETRMRKLAEENWGYEVTVRNRNRAAVTGLTLKYKIFMQDRVDNYGYYEPSEPLLVHEGEVKLPNLEFNKAAQFMTKTHLVHRVRRYHTTVNGKANERDRIRGLWVRFYKNKTLVHEWHSEDVPVDAWDFEKKPPGTPAEIVTPAGVFQP